jgi:serine/threonine protein kinase
MNCPSCSALLTKGETVCPFCGGQAAIKEPPDPLLGQILDKKYIVKQKIGSGGFGSVYMAEEPGFDRKVAIKTLHSHHTLNPMLVGRFQREGMAASKLEHPCAIRMFNIGKTQDGIPWLAMEFLEGETLGEFLEREGELTPTALLTIFVPICEALEEAHDRGIIHRDLKPDNIFLTVSRGKTLPKLLDFGIAALLDDPNNLTHTGLMSGTPTYMPPEQWEGLRGTDARSDIYALGLILYQCLAGKLPFTADSTPSWIRKHCFEPPPELSAMAKNIPATLSAVVMKTIEKRPEDRYQNVAELRRALKAAIQPISNPLTDSAPTMVASSKPRKQPTPIETKLEANDSQDQQTKLKAPAPSSGQTYDLVEIATPLPPTLFVDKASAATVFSREPLPTYASAREPDPPPPVLTPAPMAVKQPPKPAPIHVQEEDVSNLTLLEPPRQPPAPLVLPMVPSRAPEPMALEPSTKGQSIRWILWSGLAMVVALAGYFLVASSHPDATNVLTSAPINLTPLAASLPQSTPASTSLPAAPVKKPKPKSQGRFLFNDDGTITDKETGLIWAESDNGGNITYDDALKFVKEKGPEWRMPTASELKYLYLAGIRKGKGSISLTGHYVWADHDSKISEVANDCIKKKSCISDEWTFVVAFNNGVIFKTRRSVYNGRVLVVRQSAKPK